MQRIGDMMKITIKWLRQFFLLVFSMAVLASEGYSHVNLDFNKGMKPRNLSTSVKVTDIAVNPCGPDPNGADKATTVVANRMVFTPGQQYRVRWVESINHNSKYRLAFSPDLSDTFNTILMDLNQFDNDSVNPLDIPAGTRQDGAGGDYNYVVTMPTGLCENCSIQVIEKMFGQAGASLSTTKYIGCMDIRIVDPATLPQPAAPAGVKAEWLPE
jgi:hypothetical protein